jgi:cytochrome P450
MSDVKQPPRAAPAGGPTPPVPSGLALSALNPAFREHPHQVLEQLRADEPVHRDRKFDRVVLTRFEDVRAVTADRSLAVDPMRARPGAFSRVVLGIDREENFERSMLHSDDPDHKRLRGLVSQAFNQRSIDAFRPRITEIAEGLLDAVADRPGFDVIADYASPLPTIVIAEMLGVDPGDQAEFKRWSDALVHSFNPLRTPEQSAALEAAHWRLGDYFRRAVDARRANRGTDLVSAMVSAEEQGDRLSEREILITCNLLLAAGNVTTTDLMGNGVLALLRHPEELAKLKADPDLARNAVEEMLRFDPPVVQTGRITTAPREIDGVKLAAGETITASLLAAGRDPAVHADPDRFDIGRDDPRHLSFGGGLHFCLGAPLARAEAQIGIPLLFQRFPNLRLDPDQKVVRKSVPVFNGLEALRVLT